MWCLLPLPSLPLAASPARQPPAPLAWTQGQYGAAAISGQVQDPGQYNGAAGHRRWLLYPPTRVMGTGDTDYTRGW